MNLKRFEDQAARIESEPRSAGRVLFYGSSYFALWDYASLEGMFPSPPFDKPATLDHAFGGSTGAELWYYYPRLVRPYAPSALVWCEGGNDFDMGFTVKEAFGCAMAVFEAFSADFPDARLILVAPSRSPEAHRFPERLRMRERYADLLRSYAYSRERTLYIDVRPFFYSGAPYVRENLRDIYRSDGAHLSESGYAGFSEFLGGKIFPFLISEKK